MGVVDPAAPGMAGYGDQGAAQGGALSVLNKITIGQITTTSATPRTLSLLSFNQTAGETTYKPSWIIRPNTFPSGGTSTITGPWSMRMYYRLSAASAWVLPVCRFYAAGVESFRITVQSDTTSGNRHKFRLGGPAGYAALSATSTRSIVGLYRLELQVDPARTTRVVARWYYEDETTPLLSHTSDTITALPTSWNRMEIGQTVAYQAGQGQNSYADIEIYDDYNLNGQFTSNPTSPTPATTTAVGVPETNIAVDAAYNYNSTTRATARTLTTPITYGPETANDIPYTTATGASQFNRKFNLFTPPGTAPAGGWPIVIWSHSGFFTEGTRNDLPPAWRDDLIDAGYAVASIEYVRSHIDIVPAYDAYGTLNGSVYQGGRYPSHIIDYKRCAAHIRDNAATYNINNSKMFATGYSAGGYIALAAAATRDLTNDTAATPNKLTLAGATAEGKPWGDGYTGPDPKFIGVFVYAAPIDLDKAALWDTTQPKTPTLGSLATGSSTGAIINLAYRAFQAVPTTSTTQLASPAPWTRIQEFINANAANLPPIVYVRGAADYLVHWEHEAALTAAMTANNATIPTPPAGAKYTVIVVPNNHDSANNIYSKSSIVGWLDPISAAATGLPLEAVLNDEIGVSDSGQLTGFMATIEATITDVVGATDTFSGYIENLAATLVDTIGIDSSDLFKVTELEATLTDSLGVVEALGNNGVAADKSFTSPLGITDAISIENVVDTLYYDNFVDIDNEYLHSLHNFPTLTPVSDPLNSTSDLYPPNFNIVFEPGGFYANQGAYIKYSNLRQDAGYELVGIRIKNLLVSVGSWTSNTVNIGMAGLDTPSVEGNVVIYGPGAASWQQVGNSALVRLISAPAGYVDITISVNHPDEGAKLFKIVSLLDSNANYLNSMSILSLEWIWRKSVVSAFSEPKGKRIHQISPTAKIKEALTRPQINVWRAVDILDKDENMWMENAGFTSGSVSTDMGRDERRSLDITFENTERLLNLNPRGFWYDKIIRPRRGVTVDGNHYEFDLGYFSIDRISDDYERNEISVTARDYSKLMLKGKISASETFSKGESISKIIKSLALNSGIKRFDFDSTNEVLDSDSTFEADASRWEIANSIANSFGFDLFFSPSGSLTLRKQVDPITSPSVLTLGESSQNISSMSRSMSDELLFNHVVVVIENSGSDKPPIWSEVENNEPSSPTRVGAIGRRTKRITTNLASTKEEAFQIAVNFLRIAALEQYEISFDSLNYPWLDAGNIITINDSEATAFDPVKFLLTSLSIPLELGAMSGTCKRITNVGTLVDMTEFD